MNGGGTAEEAGNIDRVVNDFKVVLRDAESLVKASAGDLGEKAREARQRLNASLAAAKQNFQRLEGRAQDQVRVTGQLIRQHPYESIGVAFGAGLLLGILISR